VTDHDPSPIATLYPGYFALVMATGIIATAAALEDVDALAETLFAVAAVAYVTLSVLLAIRLVRYPRRLVADLTSHAKGFAFLTMVAGSNVLGSAAGVIHG
jgi:tellurite resistance protein TehA-like permease